MASTSEVAARSRASRVTRAAVDGPLWHRAGVRQGTEIRPLVEDEWRAAADALRLALLTGPIATEYFERGRDSWEQGDFVGAWDGEACVGMAGAFHLETTVPGGRRLTTAGVTRVGVLPTHTRRGLLTRMMDRILHTSIERGAALASLRASDTRIYGRFGYGLGGDAVSVEVDTGGALPLRAPADHGAVRLVTGDEARTEIPALYERIARARVGTIGRPSYIWRRRLRDVGEPTKEPDGKAICVAVHRGPAGDDGYVHYEVDWADGFAEAPRGAGKLHDLWGATPEVERALWSYLLHIDLVRSWRADTRPVDEPIRRVFDDARAYSVRDRYDEQWVRLLDVDAALTARAYGSGGQAVTLAVSDPAVAANTGRWTITADGAARADRATPDVSVDIATLSAAYLGATSWTDLHAAGHVDADAATLTALDTLFATRPTPFCGTSF